MTQTLELQIEALLVASPRPVDLKRLFTEHGEKPVRDALEALSGFWTGRGMAVQMREGTVALVPNRETVRALAQGQSRQRRLTEAAVETLAYVAFNQPVTIQDVEAGRGVALSKGVIDSLLDAGFIRGALRKTNSGRALTYVTTDLLLEHFGLDSLADLPGLDELEELSGAMPVDPVQIENDVPQPQDEEALGFERTNFSSAIDDTQSS